MAKVIHLDKNIDDYQAIEGLEYKTIDVSTKAFDDEKFEFDITMTSNSRDSDNEVIVQDGIDLVFLISRVQCSTTTALLVTMFRLLAR